MQRTPRKSSGAIRTVSQRPFVLPDVLAPGLRVVFCGTAPGTRSARDGAYYAHPGNHFWHALHEVGLTPRLLAPREFPQVLEFGIGLTDVAKHAFGSDAELPNTAFDAAALHRKLAHYRPRIVAFTSKNAARAGLAIGTRRIDYGEQSARIAHSRVIVLPSPSGQARGYWDIAPWRELVDAAGHEMVAQPGGAIR